MNRKPRIPTTIANKVTLNDEEISVVYVELVFILVELVELAVTKVLLGYTLLLFIVKFLLKKFLYESSHFQLFPKIII